MSKRRTRRTPLERAVSKKEMVIARLKAQQEQIRERATAEIAVIERILARHRVLLNALKSGELPP